LIFEDLDVDSRHRLIPEGKYEKVEKSKNTQLLLFMYITNIDNPDILKLLDKKDYSKLGELPGRKQFALDIIKDKHHALYSIVDEYFDQIDLISVL